uniref:Amino acid transporter transmembrane domain-containing protein n=1 Tax=Globisporangium ultimum (strain ATCC 200006 / CBS 805.95 / DAOM BR144) TaxID=431595 RepID=K3WW44_GLOUD
MTGEDRACVALLFCATFGVGSMSFGSTFAAAGPLLASLSVYFLSACNLHASVAVSKAMAAAPMSVRTFSDLGYFAFGATGRRVILLSEAGVCFLSPIAFLVLGGSILLPYMFEGTSVVHSVTEWIVFMAVGVLPIVLIPTLKGTALLCYFGCIAAMATNVICIFYSMHELKFSPRETEIETNHAVQTFGTIMFAMGTAVIIPPIQRQHTDPARLANLVSLTLLFITSIYLLVGIITYYQFGCTAPATLLDQLPANQWRQLAAGLMFVHVLIAFPVLLNPTLFDLERSILGKDGDIDVLQQTVMLRQAKIAHTDGKPILRVAPTLASLDADAFVYGSSSTPYFPHRSPTTATATMAASSRGHSSPFLHEEVTYTTRDRICSSLIRTFTVALQTFLAVMLQSSFMDILSLIGSTAITVSCMIMPCLCYLKVHPISTEHIMGQCDKAMCYVIIITSTFLGVYCTVVAAGNISSNISKYHLFQPANMTLSTGETEDQYPYCHVGERN